MDQTTGRRQELASRVFGVNARFKRMPAYFELVLTQRQRFAAGNTQLPLDQILPGNHFGDRMLNLKPGVHFHEIKRAVLREVLAGDELDGAGAHVTNGFGCVDGGLAHRCPARRRHARRWRLFEHFLVAALHRAVALEQINAISVGIGEDLDFDVPGTSQVFLDQHVFGTEGRRRLAPARGERGKEVLAFFDPPHSFSTTASRRLDQYRVAHGICLRVQKIGVLDVAVVTRRERHLRRTHDLLGR